MQYIWYLQTYVCICNGRSWIAYNPIIQSKYDELKLIYDKVEWNNKNSVLINILEVDER